MAHISFQSKLEVDSTGSYDTLDNFAMLTLPAVEVTSVESTVVDNPDEWKTYIPGLHTGTVLTAELQYTKALYSQLFALRGVKENGSGDVMWKVSSPPIKEGSDVSAVAQTFVFNGFVTKVELAGQDGPEKIMTIKLEVKVSGAITVA